MMNWVLKYIDKFMKALYYSNYVFLESVFHTSKYRKPIISVTYLISIDISLVITIIISILLEGRTDLNIDLLSLVIGVMTYLCINGLLYKYYVSVYKKIEMNYKIECFWKKCIWGGSAFIANILILYLIVLLCAL